MSAVGLVHDGRDQSEGTLRTIRDPGRLAPPAALPRLGALIWTYHHLLRPCCYLVVDGRTKSQSVTISAGCFSFRSRDIECSPRFRVASSHILTGHDRYSWTQSCKASMLHSTTRLHHRPMSYKFWLPQEAAKPKRLHLASLTFFDIITTSHGTSYASPSPSRARGR